VGVVQPSIDQYKKWDQAYEQEIKDTYSDLLDTLSESNPDIIIWPETAVPGFLPANRELYGWVRSIAKKTGAYNLIGAPYNNGDNEFYNASILFGPEGEMLGVHKKTHLVPFGEYVPFRSELAPYFGILNTLGDFKWGKNYDAFAVKSIMWASTICSENFFCGTVRRFVLNGAEIIVNQTNDAWFLKTAAAQQHFIMNVFRAIENRRPIVVAGNTGISGVVSPAGDISQQTELFERTVFTAKVSPSRKITFYTKYGDIFSQLCILIALIILLGAKHELFKMKMPKRRI
jgi:apolipoprotein N-acyltransferase